jgi:CheY-like chemotaxis protein
MSEQPATILVADDEPAIRNLLEMILGAEGHTVVTVPDGKEALAYLKDNTPDLIVLDVNMPFLSGIDVCSRIKRIKRFQHTPVVILTAMNDQRTRDEAKGVKVDLFVNKPLTGKNFRKTVQDLLEAGRARALGLGEPKVSESQVTDTPLE